MSVEAARHPVAPRAPEVALAALEAAGTSWVVLRDEADGEVDVLVAAADLDRAVGVLEGVGFARVPSWGRGTHRFLRSYDRARDEWFTVDLVAEVAFGPLVDLPSRVAPSCLARRGGVPGARRLDPTDDFWLLLLHCLLDKGGELGRHGDVLVARAAHVEAVGPVPELLRRLVGAGEPERLLAVVEAGDRTALRRAGVDLRRAWTRSAPDLVRRRRLVNAALQGSTKLIVPLRRRGLSVVLLGADGAGKSTTAEALVATYPTPARRQYGGHYGRRLPVPTGVPGLGLAARLAVQLGQECSAAVHRARGRLVVHDRHAYDARRRRPGTARPGVGRWLLGHLCLPPGLVVVLDAPAEELFRRSGEHSVAALDEQRRGYLELATQAAHAVVVDTAEGAEAVRRTVVGAVWERQVAIWRAGAGPGPGTVDADQHADVKAET